MVSFIDIFVITSQNFLVMKKLLYLFLVLPLIFSSCKKEEENNTPTPVLGCTDQQAVNYNPNATQDDCACLYDVTGVWETTSALENGVEVFIGSWSKELFYVFGPAVTFGGETGDLGFELYDMNGNMDSYGFGSTVIISETPCVGTVFDWNGTVYESSGSWAESGTINMDYITNVNNITWRYVDYPSAGDTYVKTLVRSTTYTLSNWPSVSGCMDPQAINYNPNATNEPNDSCNYSAEVVYFLYESAADSMIMYNIDYACFWDDFGNQLGCITWEWYYSNINSVPCTPDDGTVNSTIVWTGNSNSNSATFTYHIYLDDGTLFTTDNFVVNPNLCHKIGFMWSPVLSEKMENR